MVSRACVHMLSLQIGAHPSFRLAPGMQVWLPTLEGSRANSLLRVSNSGEEVAHLEGQAIAPNLYDPATQGVLMEQARTAPGPRQPIPWGMLDASWPIVVGTAWLEAHT